MKKHPEPLIGELTGKIMPRLGINGTDPETLLEGYQKALEALDHTIRLINAARNGRDYQCLSMETSNKAVAEFIDYTTSLVGACEYLVDHIDTISAQIDERNAMKRGVVLHVRKPSPEEPDA